MFTLFKKCGSSPDSLRLIPISSFQIGFQVRIPSASGTVSFEKGTIIIYEDDGSVRPKEETINQFSFFIENYDTIINKGVKSNSEGKVVNDTLSDKL